MKYEETKRKKRRKNQSDETREGEVELTGRENFRINTYNVIIDRFLLVVAKQTLIWRHLLNTVGNLSLIHI